LSKEKKDQENNQIKSYMLKYSVNSKTSNQFVKMKLEGHISIFNVRLFFQVIFVDS